MISEPRWVETRALMLLHQEFVAQFGGSPDLRDTALLDAALAQPRKRFSSDHSVDLASLAAAYATAFVSERPFVDGNERMSLLAMGLFLWINDRELHSAPGKLVHLTEALADGSLDDGRLAEWIRNHARRRRRSDLPRVTRRDPAGPRNAEFEIADQ